VSPHTQGIIYRDVKPDNFLFLTTDPDSPLKATDFGLSIRHASHEPKLTSRSGEQGCGVGLVRAGGCFASTILPSSLLLVLQNKLFAHRYADAPPCACALGAMGYANKIKSNYEVGRTCRGLGCAAAR
jgi:serine/threonine protein kinase